MTPIADYLHIMSTPPEASQPSDQPGIPETPETPSAYPHPKPQSPNPQPAAPGAPGSDPPPAPAPTPAQPNFYAQPTLVGQPAQPQPQPQPGNPYAAQPYYGPVPVPTAPGGGGGAGRAVLWAVVGAVVASAAWAGGVFLLGRGDSADLRGYSTPSNLCTGADYSSFKDEYPDDDSSPLRNSLKSDALDESYCSLSLKKTPSSYGDAYLTMQMDLHKKTDPAAEFTALWKNYRKSHSGYDVEIVKGIGDEAYLVSNDTTSGTTSGSIYATLAVRDGWMTYTMGFTEYRTTYDSDTSPPDLSEVRDWLKSDTKSTLEQTKD